MKKMASCLVYGKLHTNFEQIWYHKNKLKVSLKMIIQYGVRTYITLKF
jgi:hypothetical protein